MFNDLRLLSVFVSVYQQKGITAAARVLNVSQPSVSRSIHTLEHELGSELFRRSPSGIEPTDFADRLYKRALAIVDQVDSIYDDVTNLSKPERQLLRVGCGYGCSLKVCDAITLFNANNDEFVFNVTVASARALLADAETRGTDVIIAKRETLETASWLHIEPWQSIPVVIIVRKNHPVFNLPVDEQLDGIRSYPYVTRHMLTSAHGAIVPGEVSLRANDHTFLFRALENSDGYMWVGETMAEYANSLGLRRVGNIPWGITEYAIAYPGEKGSGVAGVFVEYLRSIIDDSMAK